VRIITCAAPAYLARDGEPRHPRELERHECLLFRDPVTGRPFPWEFHKGGEVVQVKVTGRLVVNDLATKLAACVAGQGIAQTFALGLDPLLQSGALVQVLADWAEERFPLYVYYPSRHLPPAKVRAFIDFVESIVLSFPEPAAPPAPPPSDAHASYGVRRQDRAHLDYPRQPKQPF
jgi:DNA-binding transcriptional LysR family regulator